MTEDFLTNKRAIGADLLPVTRGEARASDRHFQNGNQDSSACCTAAGANGVLSDRDLRGRTSASISDHLLPRELNQHRDLFDHTLSPPSRAGRKRHNPTNELRERVRQLRADGYSIEAIADEMGFHKNTLFRHYAADLGSPSQAGLRYVGEKSTLPRGRPRHVPTPETRAKVDQLHRAGATQMEISRAIGVSGPTLRLNYPLELGSRSDVWRRRQSGEDSTP